MLLTLDASVLKIRAQSKEMSPILETTFDSFGSDDFLPPPAPPPNPPPNRQDSGASGTSGNYRGFGQSLEKDLERAAIVESSLAEQIGSEVRIQVEYMHGKNSPKSHNNRPAIGNNYLCSNQPDKYNFPLIP